MNLETLMIHDAYKQPLVKITEDAKTWRKRLHTNKVPPAYPPRIPGMDFNDVVRKRSRKLFGYIVDDSFPVNTKECMPVRYVPDNLVPSVLKGPSNIGQIITSNIRVATPRKHSSTSRSTAK